MQSPLKQLADKAASPPANVQEAASASADLVTLGGRSVTPWPLPVHLRVLRHLLAAGTKGITALDTTDTDAPVWTERLADCISRLPAYIRLNRKLEPLTLPDGRFSRRKRYWIADRQAAQDAIDCLHAYGCEYNPAEVRTLLMQYPEEITA